MESSKNKLIVPVGSFSFKDMNIQIDNQFKPKIEAPNIIISDFRSDAGELADVISFNKEFLNRNLSEKQKEAYIAMWGEKGGEWSRKYYELVLMVGMRGGKNFWCEGDIAYTCYFISMLKDPHKYFSKITGRKLPYTVEANFDIITVSSINSLQSWRSLFYTVTRLLKSTKDPISKENWFTRYAGLDISYKTRHFNKKEIIFPNKRMGYGGIRIFTYPRSSCPGQGLHILRFYADELSQAKTKKRFHEASEMLFFAVSNSSASFPNDVGKVILTSFPNSKKDDLIYQEYLNSFENNKIYAVKAASYEFNPSITREMLESNYKKDPFGAPIIYECEKKYVKRKFRNNSYNT